MMDHSNILNISNELDINVKTDSHINTEKLIGLDGENAIRLAELSLHKEDLKFADFCLNKIEIVGDSEEDYSLDEALWQFSIIRFIKCFNEGKRFKLSAETILKNESSEAMKVFNYFKNFRDKNLVHDVNTFSQSTPFARLNAKDQKSKIQQIDCILSKANTLTQINYSNLKLLIRKSLSWVQTEFDALCKIIAVELETEQYEELYKRKDITIKPSKLCEIGKPRKTS